MLRRYNLFLHRRLTFSFLFEQTLNIYQSLCLRPFLQSINLAQLLFISYQELLTAYSLSIACAKRCWFGKLSSFHPPSLRICTTFRYRDYSVHASSRFASPRFFHCATWTDGLTPRRTAQPTLSAAGSLTPMKRSWGLSKKSRKGDWLKGYGEESGERIIQQYSSQWG